MKSIWQGSDSLLLVSMPKELTLNEKYYAIKFRLFARLCDRFAVEHYANGELVEKNLRKFGLKKPITQHQSPLKYGKLPKIEHEGFNVLFYKPKYTEFRAWIYGFDIFDTIKEWCPGVNFIEVNGNHDLSKIYPITDLLIRPNRHDGNSRMVRECQLNDIPCLYTIENPNVYWFIEKVKEYAAARNK
jgi:hypothetical protein